MNKNALLRVAKGVLVPLGLGSAASAAVAAIQMKIYGSGMTI